jgi:hypothetical protein
MPSGNNSLVCPEHGSSGFLSFARRVCTLNEEGSASHPACLTAAAQTSEALLDNYLEIPSWPGNPGPSASFHIMLPASAIMLETETMVPQTRHPHTGGVNC